MRLYFKSGGTVWTREGNELNYRPSNELLFGEAVDIDLNDAGIAKRILLERGKDSYTGAKFVDATTNSPRRSNANVVELHTILADVDGGWTVEKFFEVFKDVKFVLLPSKSHLRGKRHGNGTVDPPAHCFHALFPLDVPVVGNAEAKAVNDFIKQRLVEHGDFHFDGNAKDVSRYFAGNPYYNEVPNLKEWVLVNNGTIDIAEYVKQLPPSKNETETAAVITPVVTPVVTPVTVTANTNNSTGCPAGLQYIVDSGRFTFHNTKRDGRWEHAYFTFMGCPKNDHDISVSRKVNENGSVSLWGKTAHVFSGVVKDIHGTVIAAGSKKVRIEGFLVPQLENESETSNTNDDGITFIRLLKKANNNTAILGVVDEKLPPVAIRGCDVKTFCKRMNNTPEYLLYSGRTQVFGEMTNRPDKPTGYYKAKDQNGQTLVYFNTAVDVPCENVACRDSIDDFTADELKAVQAVLDIGAVHANGVESDFLLWCAFIGENAQYPRHKGYRNIDFEHAAAGSGKDIVFGAPRGDKPRNHEHYDPYDNEEKDRSLFQLIYGESFIAPAAAALTNNFNSWAEKALFVWYAETNGKATYTASAEAFKRYASAGDITIEKKGLDQYTVSNNATLGIAANGKALNLDSAIQRRNLSFSPKLRVKGSQVKSYFDALHNHKDAIIAFFKMIDFHKIPGYKPDSENSCDDEVIRNDADRIAFHSKYAKNLAKALSSFERDVEQVENERKVSRRSKERDHDYYDVKAWQWQLFSKDCDITSPKDFGRFKKWLQTFNPRDDELSCPNSGDDKNKCFVSVDFLRRVMVEVESGEICGEGSKNLTAPFTAPFTAPLQTLDITTLTPYFYKKGSKGSKIVISENNSSDEVTLITSMESVADAVVNRDSTAPSILLPGIDVTTTNINGLQQGNKEGNNIDSTALPQTQPQPQPAKRRLVDWFSMCFELPKVPDYVDYFTEHDRYVEDALDDFFTELQQQWAREAFVPDDLFDELVTEPEPQQSAYPGWNPGQIYPNPLMPKDNYSTPLMPKGSYF